jgi:hypothetical protein
MKTRADVALILWNKDVIQLLSFVLASRNLKSAGIEPSEGVQEIERLLALSGPDVVVFDLDPPYKRSAAVMLRLLDRFHHCSFVMTCADPALAVNSVPWLSNYPVFQKPYHLDDIVETVASLATQSLATFATSVH